MKSLLRFFSNKHNSEPKYAYDPQREKPVIRASICTGERVAGFKDRKTGVFHDIMLIRDSKDLEDFMKTYGVEDIGTEY